MPSHPERVRRNYEPYDLLALAKAYAELNPTMKDEFRVEVENARQRLEVERFYKGDMK